MGLGNFFKKLFGGASENANEPPPIENTPDPIKDASDYVIPTPEMVPETTEPIVEKTSAFANDADEDLEDIRRHDRESDNRVEEEAD